MTYRIKITKVDYCVEEEDVIDLVNVRPEYSTAWYDAIDKKIEEIKSTLPQQFRFDVDCDDEEDLEDIICDNISDETGWLVNSFEWKEVK